MASIHLEGTLLNTLQGIDVGGILTWTQLSNTGETLATTKVDLIIPPDGMYSIDVEFGRIRLDYTTEFTERFLAIVIVDGSSTATTIPELLNAAVPVKEDVIIEMEAILGDATTAKDDAETAAAEAAQSAIDAANSAASVEWKDINYSLLDNPITHLFKKNNLVANLDGALTWSRASTATYIDRYGVLQTAAIDEPREEIDGWLIEGESTNLFLNSDVGVTQVVTITNTSIYTVSFIEGAGSITISGGGAGVVTSSTDITFTATSTSVTLTVAGQADKVQVEELPFASSYIPTTGSSETRSADFVSAAVLNNIIGMDDGSNSKAFKYKLLGSTGSNQFLYGADSTPTVSFRSSAYSTSSMASPEIHYRDSSNVEATTGTLNHNVVHDLALVTDGLDLVVYADGVKGSTVLGNVNSPLDLTGVLYFGVRASLVDPMYGHLLDFRIYDFALTDAQVTFLAGV